VTNKVLKPELEEIPLNVTLFTIRVVIFDRTRVGANWRSLRRTG